MSRNSSGVVRARVWASAIAHLVGASTPAKRWPSELCHVVVCPDPPSELDDWIPPDEHRQGLDDRVLEVLASGPQPLQVIARRLGCSVSTAGMRLKRAAARGHVRCRTRGIWECGSQLDR